MHRRNAALRHLAALALGASMTLAPDARAQAPQPVRFTLANGLRVWVQEDHTRPIVLVQTTYKVGSINDGPGTTGTAHYVEHMVYRATQSIRNEDIYGFVDRVGGRYTGGTAQLATTYTETVPRWALEEALRTNAERMGRALFDSAEFERERTNVLTEANGYVATTASQILRNEVLSASFELHPYRYGSATWAQDNLVLTRAQAWNFYKSYYGPNNVVLAVVGDVNPAQVRRLVNLHFRTLARAPLSGAVTVVEPPQRVEKRVTLSYPDDQAHAEIAWRAPQAAHPDYPVLVVLDRILAARLKLALGGGQPVDVTTSHAATAYPFVYRVSAALAPGADAERVVSVVQAELDRLSREGPAGEELVRARIETGGGRGGRGGRGGGGQGAGVPPRQSNLTQVATELTSREVFAWDVSAELRERIRRAQESVTAADIIAYVDRWLGPAMRTAGMHRVGPDHARLEWSTGREIAGDRLAIVPLTTPPAKRLRPSPVPPEALLPLAKLDVPRSRRVLANGVVLRFATLRDTTSAVQLRVRLGTALRGPRDDASALLLARLVAADSAVVAAATSVTTATLTNDGYLDVRLSAPASRTRAMLEALARAVRADAFTAERIEAERTRAAAEPAAGGRGGRGGGRGGVAGDARDRVLRAVAPSWRPSDADARELIAGLSAAEMRDFAARRLVGTAIAISVVGPAQVTELATLAAETFGSVPRAREGETGLGLSAGPPSPASEERLPVSSEPQVTVLAGLPGAARRSADWRALELLNYIVGVPSYGGRLGWALTKTGLTYSSSATTTGGLTAGHIMFSTKCDTKNLESTLQAIREVIAGVGERGVTEWELREAQSFTLGRTLMYGPRDDSGPEAIAYALLESEFYGEELLDLPALSRAWLSVTLAHVNAVAHRYYRPEWLKVVAIGAIPAARERAIFGPGTFRALFEP